MTARDVNEMGNLFGLMWGGLPKERGNFLRLFEYCFSIDGGGCPLIWKKKRETCGDECVAGWGGGVGVVGWGGAEGGRGE